MTAKLPGARAALVDNQGVMRPEFYRYFLALEDQQAGSANADDLASITARLNELQAEINALPNGGSYPTLRVTQPLVSTGLLQNGLAVLSWAGTTDDVPEGTENLYYTDARADARIAAHDTFPFFLADGSPAYISLTSDIHLPFFDSTGGANNIALAA